MGFDVIDKDSYEVMSISHLKFLFIRYYIWLFALKQDHKY